MFINYDPGMTLTYFTTRSTLVAHVFEWRKLLKCHLKVKTSRKWAVGQNINDSENIGLKGIVCPHPGAIYMYVTKIFLDLLL